VAHDRGAGGNRVALLALQSGGVHLAVRCRGRGAGRLVWTTVAWERADHRFGPLGACGGGGVYRPVSGQPEGRAAPARPRPGTADGTVERLAALPLPGWGPIQWRGIAVTPSSYLVSHVTLVPPTVDPARRDRQRSRYERGACPQDLPRGALFVARARFRG